MPPFVMDIQRYVPIRGLRRKRTLFPRQDGHGSSDDDGSGGPTGRPDDRPSVSPPVPDRTDIPTTTFLLTPSSSASASIGVANNSLSQSQNSNIATLTTPSGSLDKPATSTSSSSGTTTSASIQELEKTGLALGSIIAIVIACCIVVLIAGICFILRTRMGHINKTWKRKRAESPFPDPTISSFEPREYVGSPFYVHSNNTKSLRSFATLPSFQLVHTALQTPNSAVSQAAALDYSPPPLPTLYRGKSHSKKRTSWPMNPSRSSNDTGSKSTPSASIFPGEFQFEISQTITIMDEEDNWPRTVNTTTTFPGSFVPSAIENVSSVGHSEESTKSRRSKASRFNTSSTSITSYPSLRLNSPLPPLPILPQQVKWRNEAKAANATPSKITQSRPLHLAGWFKVKRSNSVRKSADLLVIMGDLVRVLAEYDDDTAFCVNQRGKKGMLPISCLEPSSEHPRA